jgi:hypothetical protein
MSNSLNQRLWGAGAMILSGVIVYVFKDTNNVGLILWSTFSGVLTFVVGILLFIISF